MREAFPYCEAKLSILQPNKILLFAFVSKWQVFPVATDVPRDGHCVQKLH